MPTAPRKPTLLVLSQVYVPDPASVGQHMHDAAVEMARRGYRVRVLASARGYDNPRNKYPLREMRDGVDVRRLPLSSFGKKSIPIRLLGAAVFLSQAFVRGLFMPGLACILVSTSPPMCSLVAVAIGRLRRVPVKYWLMDLNPDQVVALGKARETSLSVRSFRFINRLIWGTASEIVALDRFMAERVHKRMDVQAKMHIMPPWPLEDYGDNLPHASNPFRAAHRLDGKFVFMYSGNHGPTNPIKTLLDAAVALKDDKRLVFMFIGGGSGKKEVEQSIKEHPDAGIVSLPYQPLDQLRYSLSAADVHLVTVGNEAVGIVHPCKVYGAMAVARPVLLLGPRPCHVSEILERHGIGWQVEHGDAQGCVRLIQRLAAMPQAELESIGRRAQEVVRGSLSKRALCGSFCDVLERGLVRPAPPARSSAPEAA